jgi:hypothetical protein
LIGTETTEEKGRTDALATVALFAYAAVGVAALATVLFKSLQSPAAVETMATTFGGLVLALFAAAFAPGQETGSR